MGRSRMFGDDEPRSTENQSPRTTIVGGRPPEAPGQAPPVPTGIQRLLRLAAVEPDFARELLSRRGEIAVAAGVDLTGSEKAILAAIPEGQLTQMIEHLPPPPEPRRDFLRKTAATAVMLLGGAVLSECEGSCGKKQEAAPPGSEDQVNRPQQVPRTKGCTVFEESAPDRATVREAGAKGGVIVDEPPPRPDRVPSPPGGDAINKGLARAQGDIVAWLNSDDTYLPGAISAAARALEHDPEAVMVYGDMQAVDEHSELINTLKYHQLSLEQLLCFQIIGQPAVFIRRAALDKAGRLDPSFHCLLDHQLWIRLAAQGPILHLDETLAAARFHAGAKNRAQASQFGPEAFRILDWARRDPMLAPAWTPVATRSRASAHRVDARYLLDSGQPWPALGAWTRAFFIHPPTALVRSNLAVSALLEIAGLGALRKAILRMRKEQLSG